MTEAPENPTIEDSTLPIKNNRKSRPNTLNRKKKVSVESDDEISERRSKSRSSVRSTRRHERSDTPYPYQRTTLPLWKIAKPKYVLVIKLCKDRQETLYQSKKKFFRADNRLHMAVGFCEECVDLNLNLGELIYPSKK